MRFSQSSAFPLKSSDNSPPERGVRPGGDRPFPAPPCLDIGGAAARGSQSIPAPAGRRPRFCHPVLLLPPRCWAGRPWGHPLGTCPAVGQPPRAEGGQGLPSLPALLHPCIPNSGRGGAAGSRLRPGGLGSGRWDPERGRGRGGGGCAPGEAVGRAGARCHGSLQAPPEEIAMPVTEGPSPSSWVWSGAGFGVVALGFSAPPPSLPHYLPLFFFFSGWSD